LKERGNEAQLLDLDSLFSLKEKGPWDELYDYPRSVLPCPRKNEYFIDL
jgi:hypothetical protein